ncbi:MAG TPA: hypothetical protein PKV38_18075, partial [bacterium]|nr:hypothetical protein [bacterium]
MRYLSYWIWIILLLPAGNVLGADSVLSALPNPGFEDGRTEDSRFIPDGWSPSSEACETTAPGYRSR